jgi:hypothetical protein
MLDRSCYTVGMEKKSKDINEIAFNVVQAAIGNAPKPEKPPEKEKNPAAVELGRLGGLKGGRARADKLTAEQRKEIASKAANSRWNQKKKQITPTNK